VYNVEQYIQRTLAQLKRKKIDDLLDTRYRKLRSIGEACMTNSVIRPQIPERLSVKAQLGKAAGQQKPTDLPVEDGVTG
jgi:hypothetical protein